MNSIESEDETPHISVIIDDDIPFNDYLFEHCDIENSKILIDAGLDDESMEELENKEKISNGTFKNRCKSYLNWLF